jgi:hypothetical protein
MTVNIITAVAESALRWTTSRKYGQTSNIADVDNRVSCIIARDFANRLQAQQGITIQEGPLRTEPGTQLQNVIRDWLNTEIQTRGLQLNFCNLPKVCRVRFGR